MYPIMGAEDRATLGDPVFKRNPDHVQLGVNA
jgi:hypothetical protein